MAAGPLLLQASFASSSQPAVRCGKLRLTARRGSLFVARSVRCSALRAMRCRPRAACRSLGASPLPSAGSGAPHTPGGGSALGAARPLPSGAPWSLPAEAARGHVAPGGGAGPALWRYGSGARAAPRRPGRMRRRDRSGASRCCPGTASRPGCTACAWWASTWSWARPWRYVRARGRRGSGAGPRRCSPKSPPHLRNARLCGAALRPAGIGHFLWGGVAQPRGKRGRVREGTAVLRSAKSRPAAAPLRRCPCAGRSGSSVPLRFAALRVELREAADGAGK